MVMYVVALLLFNSALVAVDAAETTVSETQFQNNVSIDSYLDPKGPNVQFVLFTRNYPPHNLKINDHEDFINSGFNLSHPTKIITHGFLSGIKEDVFVVNKNAYMISGDFNVIGMDWSALCKFEYFTAMRGAQIAGDNLGYFIEWLLQEGVGYDDIHLIGHSLGAHVAAMGAVKVKGGKVSRISGLDPARPGYDEANKMYRLDPTDAALVDVIHTNIKLTSLPEPQGHLDFYPNGGKFQPGCPGLDYIWTIRESSECNHARAYHFFAESTRNKNAFRSHRCENVQAANSGNCSIETKVYMGRAETYENGLYYLKTNGKSPYSLT